jgi:hypothetical protein
MKTDSTFTLTEIARRLGEPQHRLIHLCERAVVEPDVQDADGRGSSRLFSARNVLEFALALRLKQIHQPLAVAKAVTHVLRRFESEVRREIPRFALPGGLRGAAAPDLRLIVSDGSVLYFSLGVGGRKPRPFGGVPIEPSAGARKLRRLMKAERLPNLADFGALEGSKYSRLELSITNIARDLPID